MSRMVLTNASIFDGTSDRLQHDASVVVAGELIAAVTAGAPSYQAGDTLVDLRGKTLMPGLIDAHFHCNSPSFNIPAVDGMYPSHLAQHARRFLEDCLMRGFTTVRDAGGADRGIVQATEAGLINGPRVLISGKALSQTGGHGDMRAVDEQAICGCAYSGAISAVVDGADQVRRAVREQLRQGVDQIKLFVSGGVLSPSDPIWMNQFSDVEITAAVEEAATRRTYVMAHAHTAEAAYRCVNNGVRSIEHGTLIDMKTAEYIAGQGAFVVPTLAVIEGLHSGVVSMPAAYTEKLKNVADQAFRSVEYCQKAGVKLGLGTDLFGQLHDTQAREFVLRSQIASSAEVLRSATSVNAELINRKGKLGIVESGAMADLIVVDGDPLADISLLSDAQQNIPLIMKGGKIVKDAMGVVGARQ